MGPSEQLSHTASKCLPELPFVVLGKLVSSCSRLGPLKELRVGRKEAARSKGLPAVVLTHLHTAPSR
jgi:hypothetical protein